MEQGSAAKAHSQTGASAQRTQGIAATPDEAARRDLVAWCERHGLPVPPERGSHDGRDANRR
jgi:hypothetical protein